MKPITHPLAIAYLEAMRAHVLGASETAAVQELLAWTDAGCPLYADPTPMPAPALWMRVFAEAPLGASKLAQTAELDAIVDGVTWPDLMRRYFRDDAVIVMIIDSRTGDELWRRRG